MGWQCLLLSSSEVSFTTTLYSLCISIPTASCTLQSLSIFARFIWGCSPISFYSQRFFALSHRRARKICLSLEVPVSISKNSTRSCTQSTRYLNRMVRGKRSGSTLKTTHRCCPRLLVIAPSIVVDGLMNRLVWRSCKIAPSRQSAW